MDLTKIDRVANDAVMHLRKLRLKRGHFFMINANYLGDNECYLEYPEGIIKLVSYHKGAKDFTVIRELDADECAALREKFDLEPIQLPELHIITGSNGAGKSSVGPKHLPTHIVMACGIFDGDKLALNKIKELRASNFHSYKEAKAMANEWIPKYFHEQMISAISKRHHFAYEGHFREDAAWKTIRKFRRNGYSVHMMFFGLVNVERSAMRVLERALSGGHNVTPAEIDLNYHGNLLQLDRHFGIVDELRILDTSELKAKVLFQMRNKKVEFCLPFSELPDWFTHYLVNITRLAYPDI